jgi:FixJ family two-component response regulator
MSFNDDSPCWDAGPNVPTLFVVDDDGSVRIALRRLFASVGLRVETFASAADLLARNPAGEHGCVLLDIKMPEITGLELQRILKETRIDLPVIFLSAHADVPLSVRAMQEGALDVITKPFREHALLDAVHRAIVLDAARRRGRDEYESIRSRFETLTPRQRTVMFHVVAGRLNKEIAALMGTSMKTVKVHRAQVMAKMQARSLPDLVRLADRLQAGSEVPGEADFSGVPKVQLADRSISSLRFGSGRRPRPEERDPR